MLKEKKIVLLFFITINAIIAPNQNDLEKCCLSQNIYTPTDYTDAVIYFYSIKQLFHSIDFLSALDSKSYCYKPCYVVIQQHCIQIDSIIFFHPTIKACLEQMINAESLQPLIILLQQTPYHIVKNKFFMYEYFLLIFTIYRQFFFQDCKEISDLLTKTTLNTIMEISEKLNDLPIAEVLNAIDMLAKELPPFLEKYELNSSLTWKVWVKKYWWVPPIFTGWFGLKILLSLQRPRFYYSSYLSPRPQIALQPIITNDPVLLEIKKSNY